MNRLVVQEEIINGTNKTITYKGEIFPYFDLQLLFMCLFFGVAVFGVLYLNRKNKLKSNLITTILATLIFAILLWWYSLPPEAFYNLLGL